MEWRSDRPADADWTPELKEKDFFDSATRFNRATSSKNFQIEVLHAHLNHAHLLARVEAHTAGSVQHGEGKGPALIIGSGPSLDKIMPRLAEWEGAIFSSTSQATTLAHFGHAPEYIVAMDIATREAELTGTRVPWADLGSTLCAHPGLHPKLFEYWKDLPLALYRQMDPGNFYFTDVHPAAYPFIEAFVMVFASTVSTQVSIANLMGYSPLILCGVDFGYPQGRTRFTRWRFMDEEPPYDGPPFFDKDLACVADNGVITDRASIFYKRALYMVWRLDRMHLLSASEGILGEVPQIAVDRLMAGDFADTKLDEQAIKDVTERYLAQQNTYVIPVSGGARIFETEDWRHGVPTFAANMVAQGIRNVNIDEVMDRIAALKGEAIGTQTTERALT